MKDQTARIQDLEAQLEKEIAARKQIESQMELAIRNTEAADRAKESFIANTSHELHTPLSAILGYTELLLEDVRAGYTDGIEEDLSKILEAGVRLLNIVNQLLDLSKNETGDSELMVESFEIAGLVDEVVANQEEIATSEGNRLTISIHPEIKTLSADMYKVRQILANLLSNAGKFTSEGTIELSIQPVLKAGTEGVEIKVKDTGIGMIPEHTENIFQAFTQADTSSTRHYEGLGLGLNICWNFCQLMGGDIHVESELGTGSTFTVWLPKEVNSVAV